MRKICALWLGFMVATGGLSTFTLTSEAAGLIQRRELSLDLAKKIADAAVTTCQKNGWNLPIKVDNEAFGAVGVSGAPGSDKDEVCAKAALEVSAQEAG